MADDDSPKSADGSSVSGRITGAQIVLLPGADTRAAADDKSIVAEFNKEYAIILFGSKTTVLRQQPGAGPLDRIRFLSVDAFKLYMCNQTVQREVQVWVPELQQSVTKAKKLQKVNLWLSSPDRRSYDGIEFFPDPNLHSGSNDRQIEALVSGERPAKGYFNLWEGFSVKPCFDVPHEERRDLYSIFWDHLVTNICSGNVDHANWIFAWFANLMQRPRERPGTALVLKGGEGVGKTKVGEVIGSLIAAHYFLVDDARYLTGNFNAHMSACLLLQADEGFWAGDKAGEGRIKSLITSEVQMIESKGLDPMRMRNYVRVLISSNEEWSVPVGMDGRRFAVFQVADHAKRNHDYFKEMEAQLANGGREALLADLLELNLTTAPDIRIIPTTAALLEQKIRSFDPITSWWFGRLQNGTPTHRMQSWKQVVPTMTLFNDYVVTTERGGTRRKAAETIFGIALSKLIPGLKRRRATQEVEIIGADGRQDVVKRPVNCCILPSLDECRAYMEKLLDQSVDWSDMNSESSEEDDPSSTVDG